MHIELIISYSFLAILANDGIDNLVHLWLLVGSVLLNL